jgi:hypothetical protein
VLTLWDDQFDRTTDPITYSNFGSDELALWTGQNGNRERIENIKWAQAHCDGKFRVVLTKAKETGVFPRSIASAEPIDDLTMRIADFDPQTGEFSAVSVEG